MPIDAAARSAKERAATDRPAGLPPVARAAALRALRDGVGPGSGRAKAPAAARGAPAT